MHAKTVLKVLAASVLVPGVLGSGGGGGGGGGAGSWPDHWSYDGSGAPHFWDEVDPAKYSLCATGLRQSPINVGADDETKSSVVEKARDAVTITWSNATSFTGLSLKNLGHTIQVEGAFGANYVTKYLGNDFKMLQFHFHAPSEHHVSGDFTPLEVHFVHKSDDGKLAVLGIMIEIADSGANSTFLDPLVALLKDIPSEGTTTPVPTLDVYQAFTESNGLNSGFYTYNGSLTTPPCTEGVNWVLAKDKLKVSGFQFNAVRKLIKFSARQTQRRTFAKEIDHSAAPIAASPAVLVIVPAVILSLFLSLFGL